MSENTERRYLKWYNKIGYGSGDVAGNVVYAFLSSFVMIYLTDTVGLNPGIVGTLIAVSKLFDGLTDIFFGSMIDKTHSKLGKARPWMLYGYIGCAITLGGIFAIPMGMSEFAKYISFQRLLPLQEARSSAQMKDRQPCRPAHILLPLL